MKLPATAAIFDCGTNSLLLLVARALPSGRIIPLHQALVSPRLGEGLAGAGKLKPEALARTVQALKKLKKQALRYRPDGWIALGTNIFRRARNGRNAARFLEKKSGIPFVILSPDEEARLEFLGATSGLKIKPRVIVVDVGGGSSEIVWGRRAGIEKQLSLETGAVRLAERLRGLKVQDPATLQKLRVSITRRVAALKPKRGYRLAVLTGGTATTLVAFSLGQKKYQRKKVHGRHTSLEKLENLISELARLSLSRRRKVLAFDPARADIIVPGGIILLEILKRLEAKRIVVSDRGLRWGVALAYFS